MFLISLLQVRWLKKLDSALFSNDDRVFGDLDSYFLTFFSNDISINSITLDNTNLDDNNFADCDVEINSHVILKDLNNASFLVESGIAACQKMKKIKINSDW